MMTVALQLTFSQRLFSLVNVALQLTRYSLEPRVVFHIWRPVINENLMKHWFPKTGTKVCACFGLLWPVLECDCSYFMYDALGPLNDNEGGVFCFVQAGVGI